MKPKLLLSLPASGGENYINAFETYGFVTESEYLPHNSECDGLVLCGGGDICPSYFGESSHGSNPPDLKRDKAELSIFERYYSSGKPIFGICRGIQLINVAMGGSLYQHLAESRRHIGKEDICHPVINMHGTPIFEIFGAVMTVNSAHHQSCKILGRELSVSQMCGDVIEGIFGKNIIGVQWHPERMTANFAKKELSDPAPLFDYFKKMFH
jgi:putative glutamine amidotransferase